MKPINGNVMAKKEYRKRVTDVVRYISDCVSRTLGPCGHTALIQTADSVIATKDGWNVSKAISLDNIVDNSIKSMIESCQQSVVLKVGDGSTTVIKASSMLNEYLMDLESNHNYTIRQIETALKECVNEIIVELRKNATPITEENMYDAIYNVAMVSTNWNEEISKMIADIYVTTKNPIIKVLESGTTETKTEYINGYDLNGCLELKNFYFTDVERQVCELKNPKIIMFDHKVMDKYFIPLNLIGGILAKEGHQLVVLAPDFDVSFIHRIKNMNSMAIGKGAMLVNIVPAQYISNFNIDRECVDDFAALCGAVIIRRDDEDIIEFFDDITNSMMTKPVPTEGLEGDELQEAIKANDERNAMRDAVLQFLPEKLDEIGGTCDMITLSEKSIIINGLSNMNEKLVEDRKKTLKAEIDGKIKECDALTMLTDDIRQKRIRLGKLNCHMGIIKVGGYGKANLKTLKDALDDATRACEAAYRDGYTVGSSIAIGSAYYEIAKRNNINELYSGDELKFKIMTGIYKSFRSVFEQLWDNKGSNPVIKDADAEGGTWTFDIPWDESGKIASVSSGQLYDTCSVNHWGYDIVDGEFDKDCQKIINPVNVDVEVLQGCLRLVLNCFSSDQLIITNTDQLGDLLQVNHRTDPTLSSRRRIHKERNLIKKQSEEDSNIVTTEME